jgi:hypothetical protein
MKNQPTIAQRIKEAAASNRLEGLKAIKEEIGRDQWLNAWRDNGSKMEDWIGPKDFSKKV